MTTGVHAFQKIDLQFCCFGYSKLAPQRTTVSKAVRFIQRGLGIKGQCNTNWIFFLVFMFSFVLQMMIYFASFIIVRGFFNDNPGHLCCFKWVVKLQKHSFVFARRVTHWWHAGPGRVVCSLCKKNWTPWAFYKWWFTKNCAKSKEITMNEWKDGANKYSCKWTKRQITT